MTSFEQYLSSSLDNVLDSKVKEAMLYSLMNGGKRIRPSLLFAMLKGYGLDEEIGYACASGIEMIHTYSLIHDDLPAMDNDTLRRGKPTCHIAYGEACAILAGDGLLTQAFMQAVKASDDTMINTSIVEQFSVCAGASGMILGQIRDLEGEKVTLTSHEQLKAIHTYKTGKLIILPLVCAALLAHRKQDIPTLEEAGKKIGLSFQVQDDILDVTSTNEILGKDVHSDATNHKSTYVSIMGIEEAKVFADQRYEEAKALIKTLQIDETAIIEVFERLSNRKS